jgi:tetratricopeptide (TPR) repeat protein
MANQNESQQHHKIGKDFSRHGDFLEAREAFEKSIALNPNNASAYNNWGLALAVQKKYDEAIEQYQKAIDKDPNYAYVYNNWGNALYDQKKYDEAIEQYQKAIEKDPNNASAYFSWGNALYDQKKYDEAIEQYQKAIEKDPNYASVYRNWGNALAVQKKYDEAIEQYQKAIDKDPNYASAYFSWGIVLAVQKKYEEAIKKYQEASQIEADNVVTVYALHNIADLLWRQGKYQESWEEWEKVRKAYKNKKQTAIKFHIAHFFQYFGQVVRETAGDPKKAKEIYEEGLALEPNHIGILTGLVDLYLEKSDVDVDVNERTTAYWRAREAYNKAVGILEDQITRTQDADSYRQLGESLERYGESAELFADLGVLYTRKGRFKKACKYFEKAHRLDPDNLTIWSNLAEAYLKLNLKDKAEMEYKAILRITHGHIESHIGLGEVYTTMGDDGDGDMYDLAIHHFAEGIKLAKSMDKGSRRPKKGSKQLKTKELAAAYYSLGYARVMLYEASNTPKDESQLRQARENFVVCFKMDPDHHKAQRAKEKLEQRLNRFTPQGLIERVGPWVIAILSFLVFVVCQLGFFFNVPKSIGPDFYALLTFGSLIFMVAGLYMPHILKLRVGGIELEKSPVEQITISGSIGISK